MVSSGKNIFKISRWVIILKEGALPSSLKEIKSILLLREKWHNCFNLPFIVESLLYNCHDYDQEMLFYIN